MRYRYPLSSQEIQDELRSIYADLSTLIGYVNSSGTISVSGVYDYLDDEIDEIKDSIVHNHEVAEAQANLLKTSSNIRFYKG